MFSIVLPCHNREKFLPRSIGSAIKQSDQDWELVVVDDGSTDNTQNVVKSFNDPRIKYVYQNNSERSAARNKGIDNASGTWICFLDSDDEYQPNHLWELAKFIEDIKPSPGLIATCASDYGKTPTFGYELRHNIPYIKWKNIRSFNTSTSKVLWFKA